MPRVTIEPGRLRRSAARDSPWVYSTALRGQGQIAVDLALQPILIMPERHAAPTIDGNLNDACWKDAGVVPFQNTAFSMLGASVDFRMYRDAENLYFGYHRNPSHDGGRRCGSSGIGCDRDR